MNDTDKMDELITRMMKGENIDCAVIILFGSADVFVMACMADPILWPRFMNAYGLMREMVDAGINSPAPAGPDAPPRIAWTPKPRRIQL
jgi:hypothetical protein